MKLTISKYPLCIIILWSICCRLLFWWAYDFKVSNCPDTYAFYHLAQKVGEQFQNQIVEQKGIVQNSNPFLKTTLTNGIDLPNSKAEFIGERSPGYPFLILLCGNNKTLVVALQLVLGVFLGILFYYLLQRLQFSPRVSFILPLLLPLYLPVFWYETFVLVESVALLVVTFVFYLFYPLYHGTQMRKSSFWLFVGCLSFLVYLKPFYILLPFLIVGVLMLKNRSVFGDAKRHFKVLFFPIVSYCSWSLIVFWFTGFFVSTTFFGLNKAQNCVYFAQKGPREYQWLIDPYVRRREEAIRNNQDVAMSIWYAVNAGDYAYKGLRFSELSSIMSDFATQTIQQNPMDYLHQVITRSWWDFWRSFDGKINYRMLRGDGYFESVYQLELVLNRLLKLLFLGLGTRALFRVFLNKKGDYWTAIAFIIISVSIVQGLVTYGENARFSYPFELLMFLFLLVNIQKSTLIKHYAFQTAKYFSATRT